VTSSSATVSAAGVSAGAGGAASAGGGGAAGAWLSKGERYRWVIPWKFNSSPLKNHTIPKKGKDRLEKHHFSGASCSTSGSGVEVLFFTPLDV